MKTDLCKVDNGNTKFSGIVMRYFEDKVYIYIPHSWVTDEVRRSIPTEFQSSREGVSLLVPLDCVELIRKIDVEMHESVERFWASQDENGQPLTPPKAIFYTVLLLSIDGKTTEKLDNTWSWD